MRVDEAVRRQELSLCKKKEEDCGMKKCMFMFCSEGNLMRERPYPDREKYCAFLCSLDIEASPRNCAIRKKIWSQEEEETIPSYQFHDVSENIHV